MPRLIRLAAALLIAGPVPLVAGCGKTDEGQPNPDLKVPDVAPAGHGTKDVGKLQNKSARK